MSKDHISGLFPDFKLPMCGVSEAEVRALFPTTDENPDSVRISLWQKLGTQHYRIRFDKDIASMGAYMLVRRDVIMEALELKRIWDEKI